jgi:hypothetical protein
MIADSNLST